MGNMKFWDWVLEHLRFLLNLSGDQLLTVIETFVVGDILEALGISKDIFWRKDSRKSFPSQGFHIHPLVYLGAEEFR